MAARQVLQTAADQDPAVLTRFVGVGEIHLLLQQQRAQIFVDLLQRSIFKGFIVPFLRPPFLDFIECRPVLDDLDAGELFQDPALRRVESELGLLRLEALVRCDDAFELCRVGAGIKRHLFNQR